MICECLRCQDAANEKMARMLLEQGLRAAQGPNSLEELAKWMERVGRWLRVTA